MYDSRDHLRRQDAAVVAHAWQVQQRLQRRWWRMVRRAASGAQKIAFAGARELSGFVWAIATYRPLREEIDRRRQAFLSVASSG